MGWLLCLALVACTSEGPDDGFTPEAGREMPGQPERGAPAVDLEALRQRIQAEADSLDRGLRQVRALTGQEQAALRRDVNATQTARARQLGIRPGADVERLLETGRLVRIPDSTRYWIVRDLTYSKPYVTPDALALLAEIGERFHSELRERDLPPVRLEVTSVLRTPELQRRLRRSNPNAAAGESSHEFGTTLDIAYRRFAPPAGTPAPLQQVAGSRVGPQARELYDSLIVETAALRGAELQAILGRVITEMRKEGKLLVMMERQQTVYHLTVARRMERATPVPVE